MSISRSAGALLALTFVAGCAGANTAGGSLGPQGALPQSAKASAPTRASRGVSRHPMSAGAIGSIYVSNYLTNTITVDQPSPNFLSMSTRTISKGINGPVAIAFDTSGILYVANDGSNKVTVYDETSTAPGQVLYSISNGISAPSALGVDGKGNLWVANASSNTLTEYASGGQTPIQTITVGINGPAAVAFNTAGSGIAVANQGNNTVTVYNTTTGVRGRTISNGIATPTAIAFDYLNNVYVANGPAGTVTVYTANTTTLSDTIGNLSNAAALTFDDVNGDLWVADSRAGAVYRYQQFAPPTLPLGLAARPKLATQDDPNVYVGVTGLAAGPNYLATVGTEYITATPIIKRGRSGLPNSTILPDDVGNNKPSAIAVGP